TQQKRLKRGEKWAKDRSWHVTLVPSDTPGEVETVKWIFQTYAENEIGVREIARALNEKGIKSPHDADWGVGTVREILRNPVYQDNLLSVLRDIIRNRVLLADPENVPALNQAMTELRLQIKTLERQLSSVRQDSGNANVDSEIINAQKLFDDLMKAGGERLKE